MARKLVTITYQVELGGKHAYFSTINPLARRLGKTLIEVLEAKGHKVVDSSYTIDLGYNRHHHTEALKSFAKVVTLASGRKLRKKGA